MIIFLSERFVLLFLLKVFDSTNFQCQICKITTIHESTQNVLLTPFTFVDCLPLKNKKNMQNVIKYCKCQAYQHLACLSMLSLIMIIILK